MAETLVDSYSEANFSGALADLGNSHAMDGQSFTAIAGWLTSAKLYVKRVGSPTGNFRAQLYAHTGTYGSSSLPTGSALATSEIISVASVPTSMSLVTFTFKGINQYKMINGTKYCIVFWDDGGGDASNKLQAGLDNSSPSHSGNFMEYTASWSANSGLDLCFYVYCTLTDPNMGGSFLLNFI